MTSKKDKYEFDDPDYKRPKTSLEEILFVVESTNAIVSRNSDDLQDQYAKSIKINDIVSKILEILEGHQCVFIGECRGARD